MIEMELNWNWVANNIYDIDERPVVEKGWSRVMGHVLASPWLES